MTKATTPPYSRRVSFSERSFFSGPGVSRQALSVQYVFEGSGELSLPQLRAAVAVAAAANPGSRLVLRGALKWLRWEPVGKIPEVSLLAHWDGGNELPEALCRPFDLKAGPSCEILLTNTQPLRIVFRAFHGVMDGRGLIHFAEEVFRALRGEPCRGADSTITDSELIEQLVGKTYRPMRPFQYGPPVERSHSSQPGVHGLRLALEGHIPSLPAKIAAALVQLAQKRPDKTISFMTPVDIRFYKPTIKSMGNLSSPIYFEGQPGQDWKAIQELIMKALLDKEPLRLEASEKIFAWIPLWCTKIMINIFEGLQKRRGRYLFSSYISHINLSKRATFSCDSFQCQSAFVTAPPTEFFPLGITALTLEGLTHLTVFGPRSVVGEQQLAEIVQALQNTLQPE